MKRTLFVISILLALVFILDSCVTKRKFNSECSNHKTDKDSLNKLLTSREIEITTRCKDIDDDIAEISKLVNRMDSLRKENLKLNDSLIGYSKNASVVDPRILELANEKLSLSNRITLLEAQIRGLNEDKAKLKEELIKCKKSTSVEGESFLCAPIWARKISYLNCTFDAYVVDTRKNQIAFYWKNKKEVKYLSISNLIKDKSLAFATNAGMYTQESDPLGLFIEDGDVKVKINLTEGKGNFYMNFKDEPQTNGIFLIDKNNNVKIIKSKDYESNKKDVQFATQSGPLLLVGSNINPKFTKNSPNLNIRSGVGYMSPSKVVFIISNEDVNFYDFASVFKDYFGCTDALYLDGAISKMYLPEIGRFDTGGDFGGIIGITK